MDQPKQNLGRTLVMSFQHMFAMLGATMLVPLLSGMSIPVALLSAGFGTIIFYFVTQRKVPVFLGSSFAFLPALITIVGGGAFAIGSPEWNQRMACVMISILGAGIVYVIFSLIIKAVGVKRIKKLFPPIVVGPVIIIIGMILAPKMFWNNIIGNYDTTLGWGYSAAWQQWTAAAVTALSIVLINALAKPKSFLKVIPILLGFIIGYIYSAIIGLVHIDFSGDIVVFQQAKQVWGFWGSEGLGNIDGSMLVSAILMVVPLAVVTFMEHLGDISANSTVCGKDFMVDPGLHRTVLGDGLATAFAGLVGGPANTTYGENTAVLSITKNYNPKNIFIAAVMAVVLGIFVPFGEILQSIPSPVVGGASIVLFGMISANGLRALVDGKVDFGDTKNILVVSITLAIGLGLGAMSLAGDITGNSVLKIMIGNVELSPLAIATVAAILLNLIIPNSKKQNVGVESDAQETLSSTVSVEAADEE
jgi:uracil permease